MRRRRECRFDRFCVRSGHTPGDVVRVRLVYERLGLLGVDVVGDRRERLVLHIDELGRVLREIQAFRDNERDPIPPLTTDVWAAFCKPSLNAPATVSTNWGNEVRLTDASFDFLQAPYAEGYFLGDYQGLAAAGNDFLAFWSQPQDTDRAKIVFRRLTPAP